MWSSCTELIYPSIREIMQAYKKAVEYATGRIREYCAARGADYMLVSSEEPLNRLFFERLTSEGVLK